MRLKRTIKKFNNKTKRNKTKRNKTKRNKTKRNKTKRNITKRNKQQQGGNITRAAEKSIIQNNISLEEFNALKHYINLNSPNQVQGFGDNARLIYRYNNLEAVVNHDNSMLIFIKRISPSEYVVQPDTSQLCRSRGPGPSSVSEPHQSSRLHDFASYARTRASAPALSPSLSPSFAPALAPSFAPTSARAPASLHSSISQPYSYHPIRGSDKSAVGRRCGSAYSSAIDCARCAASYSGFGKGTDGLPSLQKHSIENNGTLFEAFDDWLREYATQHDIKPQLYAIHPHFIKSFGKSIAITSQYIANKLLDLNEVALVATVRAGCGHYLNIVKDATNKNKVWIVDPQSEIDQGEYTLAKYIDWENRQIPDDPIMNLLFVLTPDQASQLVDNEGSPMVVLANYGTPKKGWWKY